MIQEFDSKQRKIRSLRGFFLYALEIIENAQDYEILSTNFQPFFWKKVKNITRQNKKGALVEFLFGSDNGRGDSYQSSSPALDAKIQNLQNQVNSLQDRISDLETTLKNSKYALSGTLDAPDGTKIIQHGDYTLEVKKGPSLPENDPKRASAVLSEVRNPTSQRNEAQAPFGKAKGMESKPLLASVSQASQSPFKTSEQSEQYNIPSEQDKALNKPNFITLSKISEQEKIEIIQRGFQLQAEGKISLKKYYEDTETDSLFQLKGYNIKYEAIRKNRLYQSLKT